MKECSPTSSEDSPLEAAIERLEEMRAGAQWPPLVSGASIESKRKRIDAARQNLPAIPTYERKPTTDPDWRKFRMELRMPGTRDEWDRLMAFSFLVFSMGMAALAICYAAFRLRYY